MTGIVIERQTVCFYHTSREKGPYRKEQHEGCGDCRECLPDTVMNPLCRGYIPVTVRMMSIEAVLAGE